MKPKINKTITTKGGGNIVIPNKIIKSEYPENNGGDDPSPVEPDIYIVKITNLSELPEHFRKLTVASSGTSNVYNCLQVDNNENNRLFKTLSKSYYQTIICIYSYASDTGGERLYRAMGINTTSYKPKQSWTWYELSRLEFLCFNKSYLKALISDLSSEVRYETNFAE